jgi:rhamnosyl/mannosyltransferase
LLVAPGNAVELAEAIRRLLDDADLACRLGAMARQRAREQFSREAMVGRFEDFYASLAQGRAA